MVTDRDIFHALGPVGESFFGSFKELREVQRRAIPPILSGDSVFVASATASGKTEAIVAPLVSRTRSRVPPNPPRTCVLIIAPTRALVNDLTARIENPLARLDITCGRQTSDHRDKGRAPFVLVTTPESFDSMLVRDARLERGTTVDHMLAGVSAVFIDEAHLLDGNARGDQLCWLLGRLRRLRSRNDRRLQLCAGSATVSDAQELAARLLGGRAVVVRVPGTRKVEVFGIPDASSSFMLEPSLDVNAVRNRLEIAPSAEFNATVERRIWQALSSDGNRIRKILVFVPTRNLSDTLSTHLAGASLRREITVLAHHGSLSREFRERAERTFATARDAVLVATTTLEVGIDIGDVDLVALVGAPPNTRSLLQRIGRSGRRIGRTRILALPRTPIEQAALASMLISARDGALETERYGRRWSVFVQQAASFVAQNRPRGRRRSDVLSLVRDVWGDDSIETTNTIIEALLSADCLAENRQRLVLGEAWADSFDVGGRGMHANFSSGAGIPVVDASTGETVAHVSQRPAGDKGLALGGQTWDLHAETRDELLLKPRHTGGVREGFEYATRSGPTGLEYATHVRRGWDLSELDAPFIELSGGLIWFHFGGSAYQTLLCDLVPGLRPAGTLSGLAIAGRPSGTALRDLATQEAVLRDAVDNSYEVLERVLSVGPYQRYLPDQCRREVVADLLDVTAFGHWLQTRDLWRMKRTDPRWDQLSAVFPRRR